VHHTPLCSNSVACAFGNGLVFGHLLPIPGSSGSSLPDNYCFYIILSGESIVLKLGKKLTVRIKHLNSGYMRNNESLENNMRVNHQVFARIAKTYPGIGYRKRSNSGFPLKPKSFNNNKAVTHTSRKRIFKIWVLICFQGIIYWNQIRSTCKKIIGKRN